MIKVAICDDNILMTSEIEKLILDMDNSKDIETVVFFSGEELLKYIENGERFDLLYLDIEMGAINGIDTAHAIREVDKNILIIYITSHVKFAPSAFEVNAFRFLSKPINKEKFFKYYMLAMRRIIKKPKYFRYTFKRQNFQILISEIIYFESSQRVTYIRTGDLKEGKCYEKLNNIEKYLVDNNLKFYRVSQSLLVNPDYVY